MASRGTTRTHPGIRRTAKPTDLPLQFLQDDIDQSFRDLNKGTPWQEGRTISIDFSTGLDQTVPHKLGSTVKGFVPCDLTGAAAKVYRSTPTDAKQAKTHVRFVADVACKFTAWVYV